MSSTKAKNFHKIELPIGPVLSMAASGFVTHFSTPNGLPGKITPAIQMLAAKGCKCDVCGVEGDHFKIRKSTHGALTLFNKNGTVMTIDHHTPKCNGGRNHIENYIPLCGPCNSNWKSEFDIIEKDMSQGIIRLTKEDIVK
jgi:hypothetical protein